MLLKPSGRRFLVNLAAFFAVAFVIASFQVREMSADPLRLAAAESASCRVKGVCTRVRPGDGKTELTLGVSSLRRVGSPEQPSAGSMSLRAPGCLPRTWEGKGVSVLTRLSLPEKEFDGYYLSKGIYAQGKCGTVLPEPALDSRFRSFYGRLKRLVREALMEGLPHQPGALLQGIVLGEREELDPGLEEDFRRTGTSHILAVSGENLAMLLGFVLAALGALAVPVRVAYAVTVPVVILYAALTGFEPSVLRALFSGLLGLVALYLGRLRDGLDLLAIACILLTTMNAFMLNHVGYQLSFAAAVSMMTMTPRLMPMFKRLPGWAATICAGTSAAQLGVAPILALSFGQISIIGFLANLFVLPVVGLILTVGLVSMSVHTLLPSLSRFLNALTAPGLYYLIYNARWLSAIPGAAVSVDKPGLFAVATWYGGLSLLLFRRDLLRARLPQTAAVGIAVCLLVMGWRAVAERPPATATLTFFDCGEGDCIGIRTPEGFDAMIDTGPEPDSAVLALQRGGFPHLDLLVLTHPHADHSAGLAEAVRATEVKRFWAPCPPGGKDGVLAVSRMERQGTELISAAPGQCYRAGGLVLKALHAAPAEADTNERSLVLRLQWPGGSALLTGDAEKALSRLADADLDVDIFKLPHHGSALEGIGDLMKRISPRLAVISVGQPNRFGHPVQGTLSAIASCRVPLLRTDRDGDIVFRLTERGEELLD